MECDHQSLDPEIADPCPMHRIMLRERRPARFGEDAITADMAEHIGQGRNGGIEEREGRQHDRGERDPAPLVVAIGYAGLTVAGIAAGISQWRRERSRGWL